MYNTFPLCLKTGTESAAELVVKREKSAKVRTDVTVYVSNVCRREVKNIPDRLIFWRAFAHDRGYEARRDENRSIENRMGQNHI